MNVTMLKSSSRFAAVSYNEKYRMTDAGVKAHLNLAVLAYWIVSVTKYRLKMKEYPNVRWDEIVRIAQAQVVVTAEMETAGATR